MSWANMECKTTKSKSLVSKREIAIGSFRFKFPGTIIPKLKEKPVSFIKNICAFQKYFIELEATLRKVDNSGLSGCFKVWAYQYTKYVMALGPIWVELATSVTKEKNCSCLL